VVRVSKAHQFQQICEMPSCCWGQTVLWLLWLQHPGTNLLTKLHILVVSLPETNQPTKKA